MILPAVYRDGEAFGKRGDVFSFLSGRCGKWGGRGVKRGSRVVLRRDWRRNRKHYHSHLQVILFFGLNKQMLQVSVLRDQMFNMHLGYSYPSSIWRALCRWENIFEAGHISCWHKSDIKPPVRTKSLTSIQRKHLTSEPAHKHLHEKHPGQISHWAGLKFNF